MPAFFSPLKYMSSVKNIKNFTVAADLGSGSSFRRSINLAFQPTDAIIRQISYNGLVASETGVFLIWCSLLNDYIGSFQVNNFGITLQPRIQLHLLSPAQQIDVQFQIHAVSAGGSISPTDTLVGRLVVLIDFIQN